ncbi:Uncharacterised protein [Mycobacterium tuberculosis]|nr:Uncharacterised protein [Mycobacterium tuberculosis]
MKVRAFVGFLQRFMGFIQRLWTGDFNEGVFVRPVDGRWVFGLRVDLLYISLRCP